MCIVPPEFGIFDSNLAQRNSSLLNAWVKWVREWKKINHNVFGLGNFRKNSAEIRYNDK